MAKNTEPRKIKKPSLFWLATEPVRAATELGISIPYRKLFHKNYKGDGHPVLVLPGFMASDTSTNPLRKFIEKLGYNAYAWELGRNTAKLEILDVLIDKLEDIYHETGQEITVIGWSLGGVYARQIAKAKPEMVRQIITLGSPFAGITEPNNATWIYNIVSNGKRIVDLDPDQESTLELLLKAHPHLDAKGTEMGSAHWLFAWRHGLFAFIDRNLYSFSQTRH